MRGSFLAVYGRDSKKILKIQQLRLTAFVPYIYTPADFKAIFLKMPSPEYSYEARRRRFTGSGLFRLFVDEKGQVESVKILKSTGYPELDSSSVKTLREWQARPGNRREVDVPVNFIMETRRATLDYGPVMGKHSGDTLRVNVICYWLMVRAAIVTAGRLAFS